MITYEKSKGVIKVYLEGAKVGAIHPVKGGFQYFAKGQKDGGDVFPMITECKNSLEEA